MVHQRKTTVLHASTSEFCQNAAVLTRLRPLKWFAACLKSLQTVIFFCLARNGCGGNIKLTEWLVCSTAFRMSQSNILCIQFHVFPSVNKNPIHTKLGDFMNLKILVLLAKHLCTFAFRCVQRLSGMSRVVSLHGGCLTVW